MIAGDRFFLLDSSVLVKLFHSEEEDSDIALLLRKGHLENRWELRLADISFYELANALHYLGKYSIQEIVEGIQSLIALELQVYGFDSLTLLAALGLCEEKEIAIYDAYLVALARREGLTFVTADERLQRKLLSDPTVVSLTQFSRRIEDKKD
jgi:predicted nucleic acid-binding protein